MMTGMQYTEQVVCKALIAEQLCNHKNHMPCAARCRQDRQHSRTRTSLSAAGLASEQEFAHQVAQSGDARHEGDNSAADRLEHLGQV